MTLFNEQRKSYVDLMKESVDVFAWYYEDLKTDDPSIFQHKIPLKLCMNPFSQNIRQVNPVLLPLIEKAVKIYWMQKLLCL